MTLLPIVGRELRVAARRKATYWFRFGAAAAIIVAGVWVFLAESRWSTPNQVGRLVFGWESSLVFAVCLFSGVFLTADCLSFEQREGTLGLLFLADLRGHDIVLGKLAAASALCFSGVAAALPMMGLPLLLGGTTGGEFARLMLVLVGTMTWSLALGMLVSACGRDSRQTLMLTLGLILMLAFGPVLLAMFLSWAFHWRDAEWLALLTPVGGLLLMFDGYYHRPEGRFFWPSVGALASMSLLALSLASRILPGRVTERVEPRVARRRLPPWLRVRRKNSPDVQLRELERNPYFWLVARDRLGARLASRCLLLACGTWACFFLTALTSDTGGRRQDLFGVSLVIAYALHVLFKLFLAVEVTRRFHDDRRSGAMELLLVTPLRAEEILEGHADALRAAFVWPARCLITINLALFVALLTSDPMQMGSDASFFGLVLFCGIALLFTDRYATLWIGAREALLCKRHHWAALSVFVRVMLPTGLGVLAFFLLASAGVMRGGPPTGAFLFWSLVSCGYALALGSSADARLKHELRGAANGEIARSPRQVWSELSRLAPSERTGELLP